jgi:hypothetical protein
MVVIRSVVTFAGLASAAPLLDLGALFNLGFGGGNKDAPSYEAPSYEAPSYEAPSYDDAPSYDAPVYGAPPAYKPTTTAPVYKPTTTAPVYKPTTTSTAPVYKPTTTSTAPVYKPTTTAPSYVVSTYSVPATSYATYTETEVRSSRQYVHVVERY